MKYSTPNKISELRRQVAYHSHLYHALGRPEITDSAYDAMFQELLELERSFPSLYDSHSPTQRVGSESVSTFAKVRHGRRMLSLDNVFSADEVRRVLGPHAEWVVIEPKIDGLSLKLIYTDGKLVQALTRGDGQIGDDVTENAKTIKSIPLELLAPVSVEVTGEVCLSREDFVRLNQSVSEAGDEEFANARNAAAGTLKLKDPKEVAKRNLGFVAHGVSVDVEGLTSQMALIAWLQELGFRSVGTSYFSVAFSDGSEEVFTRRVNLNTDDLEGVIAKLDSMRPALFVDTDGLVIKIDDLVVQRELGVGTRAPKWAVAYKFPPEVKSTELNDIVYQVGRTGKITPVAELAPVVLGGTTVARASLCNREEIARLGVDIGDRVLVVKSAEIIPKVTGCAEKRSSSAHATFPTRCPCCAEPLQEYPGLVDLFCPNPCCSDQVKQRLIYAVGKGALDIDGFGKTAVALTVAAGLTQLSSILSVSDFPFLKEAAKKRIQAGIKMVPKQPLWRKLNALSVEGWGRSTWQDVVAAWPTFDRILTAAEVIDGKSALRDFVGDHRYSELVRFLEVYGEEVEALANLKYFDDADGSSALGTLSGKIFCITGSLESGTRDEVTRRIEQAGGSVKNSCTRKVQYLVAGSDVGSTKLSAAVKFGVQVISEDDLYSMLGTPKPNPTGIDEY